MTLKCRLSERAALATQLAFLADLVDDGDDLEGTLDCIELDMLTARCERLGVAVPLPEAEGDDLRKLAGDALLLSLGALGDLGDDVTLRCAGCGEWTLPDGGRALCPQCADQLPPDPLARLVHLAGDRWTIESLS